MSANQRSTLASFFGLCFPHTHLHAYCLSIFLSLFDFFSLSTFSVVCFFLSVPVACLLFILLFPWTSSNPFHSVSLPLSLLIFLSPCCRCQQELVVGRTDRVVEIYRLTPDDMGRQRATTVDSGMAGEGPWHVLTPETIAVPAAVPENASQAKDGSTPLNVPSAAETPATSTATAPTVTRQGATADGMYPAVSIKAEGFTAQLLRTYHLDGQVQDTAFAHCGGKTASILRIFKGLQHSVRFEKLSVWNWSWRV